MIPYFLNLIRIIRRKLRVSTHDVRSLRSYLITLRTKQTKVLNFYLLGYVANLLTHPSSISFLFIRLVFFFFRYDFVQNHSDILLRWLIILRVTLWSLSFLEHKISWFHTIYLFVSYIEQRRTVRYLRDDVPRTNVKFVRCNITFQVKVHSYKPTLSLLRRTSPF